MTPDGTKVINQEKYVFDGRSTQPTIEGPKLYKRNGYYYIFAPAGGVPSGWQTVLRSKNIWGPYEEKIVMDQGKTTTNGPHQGAWLRLDSGEDWFIHFQDRAAYGRIIHLQPMRWKDDWPVIGIDNDGDGKGEPVLTYKKPNVGKSYPIMVPQTSDEFISKKLGLQWQWHANPESTWMSLALKPGSLRLKSMSVPDDYLGLWQVPNLLLQKMPAREFTLTTKVNSNLLNVGEKTGLVIMGMDYSYLAITKTEKGLRLIRATCLKAEQKGKETIEKEIELKSGSLILRVSVVAEGKCSFSYSLDGTTFTPLGQEFTAREGRWIGAKVGLFAIDEARSKKPGYADFDWFRFN
jgi:beta-xylosidase